MRKLSLAVTLATVFAIPTAALAAVPAQITVQGKLTDAGGNPLPAGPKSFVFRIYNQQVGGVEIWPGDLGDAQTISSDADGLWSANIGASIPLIEAVFDSDVRWLQVIVESTLLPRVRLVTGPYAYRVSTVDGANGGWIATKVAIGPGTIASGINAFAAGESDSATGDWSTVGGGKQNIASSEYSTVAGGLANSAKSFRGFIGGGAENTALFDAWYAVIGGGLQNSIGVGTRVDSWGTIGGGFQNKIGTGSADVYYGTIGGGYNNWITGAQGCIPGGGGNVAGSGSFACGVNAGAIHSSSFVWCDGNPISTANTQQFVARASNGFAFHTSPGNTGCWLFADASAWSPISDSSMKENRQPVDGAELLNRLAAIPVETWNYIEQGDSIRHIGPMAQDFYRAFGVGESDKHISTIDADGVALAAIQALNEELQKQRAENDKLRDQINELCRLIKQ
jgi:hypothetical protein